MAQKIPFMKLSGAGNDFVIIDNRKNVVQYENTDFVQKVCQRRMSAGADGVLLVENTDKADFRMRYFNADGGEAETCGNGARCISRFAYINGIVSDRMSFETQAGIYESEIVGTDVKVRMSDPTRPPTEFSAAFGRWCSQYLFRQQRCSPCPLFR